MAQNRQAYHLKKPRSFKNKSRDAKTCEKLPLLYSAMSNSASIHRPIPNGSIVEKQPSELLPMSCSRCQSLRAGSSLHLTLAYRKCRCHRQFESKISDSNRTVAISTPSNSGIAGEAALLLPPLASAYSLQQPAPVIDSTKRLVEGNIISSETLPIIVT